MGVGVPGVGVGVDAGSINNVRRAVPVPAVLPADRTTENTPSTPGTPEIRPVASTVSPAGRPTAPKLVGELLAVIR